MAAKGIQSLERRVINTGKSSPAVPAAHRLHFRNRGNKAAPISKRCLPRGRAATRLYNPQPNRPPPKGNFYVLG